MLQQVGHEATGCQSSFPGVKGSANEVNHSHPSRTNRADISKHPPPPPKKKKWVAIKAKRNPRCKSSLQFFISLHSLLSLWQHERNENLRHAISLRKLLNEFQFP